MQHSRNAKTSDTLFLVYDLESTGFDVCKDKIVQIAICAMRLDCSKQKAAFESVFEFSSYVNPNGRRMSKGAEKVTGISTSGPKGAMLRRCPFFKEVWTNHFIPKFKSQTRSLCIDEVCFLGHNNIRYDDLLLSSELLYAGIDVSQSLGIENTTSRDSLSLAKQLQTQIGKSALPRTNLGAIYSFFTKGQVLENAHDALADCRATAFIVERMWDGNVEAFSSVPFATQVAKLHTRRSDKKLVTKVRFPSLMKNAQSKTTPFKRPRDSGPPIPVQKQPRSFFDCTKCRSVISTYFTDCGVCTHNTIGLHN